ncbi:hypothetical protein H072_7911 [Dactylellina haptotyla CBS 200.50]|uniref:Alpha/beta hydrolase fold-3 domain-containing protein n=1 Tax=Dactylellina haptotyla (strain CBS 200.50) TaxID=1284197 RepID=S8BG46_DACHA|nr:hypothetical protein H072_7911 [Dactylellina haptotyla CBS 200.50]
MHRVLGVVSWLDCLIFVIFLAPQLLIDPHAGFVKVLFWLIAAIPYFGGGFTMGSSYFYLEFLASLASKLKDTGFKNPSVFAIDYTLVPDSKFPTQLNEAYKGYQILHELAREAELVICGDSAGGNLALALLLRLARPPNGYEIDKSLRKPSYATLISPWTILVSPNNDNTKGDFLDAPQLHKYGISYANSGDISDPYKSPGLCEDLRWWEEALPVNGVHVLYGNMEVFSAGIRKLISMIEEMKTIKLKVTERTTVHAWPVVQLFLGSSMREREEGLDIMAGAISEALLLRKTTDAPN